MSHFAYGNHTEKRIGVWLRYESNPDIMMFIKKHPCLKYLDMVSRIVVSDYDEETKDVWIQVWCKNLIDIILWKKHRYNVFYIKVKPNPEWICEGDLGVGFK